MQGYIQVGSAAGALEEGLIHLVVNVSCDSRLAKHKKLKNGVL